MITIHGHEVLEMMLDSNQAFTKPGLIAAIRSKFGPEARFHTCSANGLSAEELVDFLEAKGKFVPRQGGFQTAPELICSH